MSDKKKKNPLMGDNSTRTMQDEIDIIELGDRATDALRNENSPLIKSIYKKITERDR